MKSLGSTKKDVDQDKDGGDVPRLECVADFLVHCNLVNNSYQQASKCCLVLCLIKHSVKSLLFHLIH